LLDRPFLPLVAMAETELQSLGPSVPSGGLASPPAGAAEARLAELKAALATKYWRNGRTGPLLSGQPVCQDLERIETGWLVAREYTFSQEESSHLFRSFVLLRLLLVQQHPEFALLKQDSQVLGSHKLIEESRDLVMTSSSVAVDGQGRIVLTREDVLRVATFISESRQFAEIQTEIFMKTFDKGGKGVVEEEDFTAVFQAACEDHYLTWTERLFFLFDEPSASRLSLYLAVFIMLVIVVSSIGFVLASEPSFQVDADDDDEPPEEHQAFWFVEAVCIGIFTIEYGVRVCTVWAVREELRPSNSSFVLFSPGKGDESFGRQLVQYHRIHGTTFSSSREAASSVVALPDAVPLEEDDEEAEQSKEERAALAKIPSKNPFVRIITYITRPMNMIDAVAIVPFYIELALGSGAGGLAVLRVLRLARVFRIFKVGKYNEGINMLAQVMLLSVPAFNLLIFFSSIGVVLFGSLIYFAEGGRWHKPDDEFPDGAYLRPDVLGTGREVTPFSSIPRCFWWVVVTATTVGYGDLFPTTHTGKLVASITMIAGLLVLALPITIIGANFGNEYAAAEQRKKVAKETARHAVTEAEHRSSADDARRRASSLGDPSSFLNGGTGSYSPLGESPAFFASASTIPSFLYNLRAHITSTAQAGQQQAELDSGKASGPSKDSGSRGEQSVGQGLAAGAVLELLKTQKTLLDRGQRVLDTLQQLHCNHSLPAAAAATIAREVQVLATKRVLFGRSAALGGSSEDPGNEAEVGAADVNSDTVLSGRDVDLALQVVLTWIQRSSKKNNNTDEDDKAGDPAAPASNDDDDAAQAGNLEPEDERRLRHHFLAFAVHCIPF